MGCNFSCRSSRPLDCVRVVHINGYIEDFAGPITVSDVTGKPPKHVLCSSAQLLSTGAQPLRLDDSLEPGRIYFLLPHTVFQSDSSPIDLASLMTRLTAIAKRGGGSGNSAGLGSVLYEPVRAEGVAKLGSSSFGRMSCRARSWKPALDPIEERSFGHSMRDSSSSIGVST